MNSEKKAVVTRLQVNGHNIRFLFIMSDMRHADSITAEPLDSDPVGTVYSARITGLTSSPDAAFASIKDKEKAFISGSELDRAIILHGDRKRLTGSTILASKKREKVKGKYVTLSSEISLHSRHLILINKPGGLHISKKTGKEDLIILNSGLEELVPPDMTLITRTDAADASIVDIQNECSKLILQYRDLLKKASAAADSSTVYRPPGIVSDLAMHLTINDVSEIISDDREFINEYRRNTADLPLREYNDDYPLSKLYCLQSVLDHARDRVVHLKSGAEIVIDETEAMNVIDVNTACHVSKVSRYEDFLSVNKEAAEEIARQLKIRNLSGIIIVDFLKMKDSSDEEKIIDLMKDLTRNDRFHVDVVGFTKLGLLEMTRIKRLMPLSQLLTQ